MEDGKAKIICSCSDGVTTPSIVAIDKKTGERLVGRKAKEHMVVDPENVIFSAKRFMGRKYDELEKDPVLQKANELTPYKLRRAENGDVWIRMNDRVYSPPEISAMILQKLKADAEAHLGETVDQAVITVPAYFNDHQRKATEVAGRIAGLEVLRIINEPTAASLAYGVDQNRDGLIAVFDLGGGTFDITILELRNGIFDVKATNGDTFLGGDDIDAEIMNWLAYEIDRKYDVNILENITAKRRIKQEAEKAKIALSNEARVAIDLPNIITIEGESIDFGTILDRETLGRLADDFVRRTLEPCGKALEDANLSASDVDIVLLVGGMTRMPAIREAVKGYFDNEPADGVNPDEAVALGAAIQAGIMGGDVTGIVLLDVTPLTLSIETSGDIASHMITRNTTIPTQVTKPFTTAKDDQTSVEINVVQGERKMASDNTSLGQFSLDGIPPKPRREAKFLVTFDIDANGILRVSAKDKDTNREKHITISAASGLSDEEVKRAMAEAEKYLHEDTERKNRAEADNNADFTIYKARRQLQKRGNELQPNIVATTEHKINAIELAREHGTTEKIISTTKDLEQELDRLY